MSLHPLPTLADMTDTVPVTVMPRLDIARDRLQMTVAEGTTLAEMVAQALPALPSEQHAWVRVTIGDQLVPAEHWHRVRPKAGAPVLIRVAPAGNFLKQALMIAVSIAALALGAFFAPALGGVLGLSAATWNTIIVGGTMLAGSLLINALIPQKPPEKDKPKYTISGGRNGINPDAPVPIALGTIRMAPPFAVLPFTEDIGANQYFNAIYVIGIGEHAINRLRIGDAPIDTFNDVQTEVRYGTTADLPLTLYSQQVYEQAETTQIGREDGALHRVSGGDATALSVSIRFPGGLMLMNKKGKKKPFTVRLRIRYRLAGTATWLEAKLLVVRRKTSKEFRVSHRWKVAVRGRYEIEIERVTGDTDEDPQVTALTFLSSIRTFRPEYPLNMPPEAPLALIAVRIKASRQLQGTLDNLTAEVSPLVPDYDRISGTWIVRATRNPASIARYLLQGPAATWPMSDARIDLAQLADWHQYCAANGLTYDGVVDSEVKLRETLAEVCAAGRARPLDRGDRWGVVIDRPVDTVTAVVTPRNARAIGWSPAYVRTPDAVRIPFFDRSNNFEKAERVVPWLGFSGTPQVTEEWEFAGLTDADAIWRAARRRMHEMRLRPHPYTATQDIEALAVEPGDRVMLSHPYLAEEAVAARITMVRGRSIVLDAPVSMTAGQTYRLRIRAADGSTRQADIVTHAGETTLVTMVYAMSPAPQPGDLVLFGRYGVEAIDCIVNRIEPGDDQTAVISLVAHAPELDALAAAEVPPVWDGRAGGAVDDTRMPASPRIVEITSGYELPDDPPGTLNLLLAPALYDPVPVDTYNLRHRVKGAANWIVIIDAGSMPDLIYGAGTIIDLSVQAVSWNGLASAWSGTQTYTVLPMTAAGPVLASFVVDKLSNGIRRYTWSFIDPPGAEINEQIGVQIRFRAGAWSNWDDLADLHSGMLIASPHESTEPAADGTYTFAARGIDFDGVAGPPKFVTLSTQPAAPVRITGTRRTNDIDISVTMAVTQDSGYVRVYRSLVSAAVSTETDTSGLLSAPPGTIVTWTDVGAAASGKPAYRYRARAENAAGVKSLPTSEALP